MSQADRQFARDEIDKFLRGDTVGFEWDDFTAIRIKNKYVDAVRRLCLHVSDEFPPVPGSGFYCSDEGYAVLRAARDHLL